MQLFSYNSFKCVSLCKKAIQIVKCFLKASPYVCLLRNQVADLSKCYASNNIHNHMLSCSKRRDKYCQGTQKRNHLIPFWNFYVTYNTYKAKPTDKTVNGWKKICWRIDFVEKTNGIIKNPLPFYSRTYQRSRITKKNTRHTIRVKKSADKKTVGILSASSVNQNIN